MRLRSQASRQRHDLLCSMSLPLLYQTLRLDSPCLLKIPFLIRPKKEDVGVSLIGCLYLIIEQAKAPFLLALQVKKILLPKWCIVNVKS